MTASMHPVFTHPSDTEALIWRYMDFTKFVSMLENNALYFSRADGLGDPFEGSYSRGNEKMRPEIYKDWEPHVIQEAEHLYKRKIKEVFINCWHMNAHESAGMWRLYAKTNEAIAIRSTFSKLFNALDSKCHLGVVKYVDYENDWIPEGNAYYPFVHKRLSFAHEQEVRALFNAPYFKLHDERNSSRIFNPAEGMWGHLELNSIIDLIYIAPTAPIWFKRLVEQIVRKYSLNKQVVQSSLDNEPFY